MKIVIGGHFGEPKAEFDGDVIVSFVADDGRAIFEIRADGGAEVDVTAAGAFKVGGVLYAGRFVVVPRAANCVTLRSMTWDEAKQS